VSSTVLAKATPYTVSGQSGGRQSCGSGQTHYPYAIRVTGHFARLSASCSLSLVDPKSPTHRGLRDPPSAPDAHPLDHGENSCPSNCLRFLARNVPRYSRRDGRSCGSTNGPRHSACDSAWSNVRRGRRYFTRPGPFVSARNSPRPSSRFSRRNCTCIRDRSCPEPFALPDNGRGFWLDSGRTRAVRHST